MKILTRFTGLALLISSSFMINAADEGFDEQEIQTAIALSLSESESVKLPDKKILSKDSQLEIANAESLATERKRQATIWKEEREKRENYLEESGIYLKIVKEKNRRFQKELEIIKVIVQAIVGDKFIDKPLENRPLFKAPVFSKDSVEQTGTFIYDSKEYLQRVKEQNNHIQKEVQICEKIVCLLMGKEKYEAMAKKIEDRRRQEDAEIAANVRKAYEEKKKWKQEEQKEEQKKVDEENLRRKARRILEKEKEDAAELKNQQEAASRRLALQLEQKSREEKEQQKKRIEASAALAYKSQQKERKAQEEARKKRQLIEEQQSLALVQKILVDERKTQSVKKRVQQATTNYNFDQTKRLLLVEYMSIFKHIGTLTQNTDVHALDSYIFGSEKKIITLLNIGKLFNIDNPDHTLSEVGQEMIRFVNNNKDYFKEYKYEGNVKNLSEITAILNSHFAKMDNEINGICPEAREAWSRAWSLALELYLKDNDETAIQIIFDQAIEGHLTNGGCIQGRINRGFIGYAKLLHAAGVELGY